MTTTIEELINQGNNFRAEHKPLEALKCYATALINDPNSVSAFNNYGNVMRECGHPERAIPFLQNAVAMAPDFVTGQFNLAVAYLLMGRYKEGFEQYEWRWKYEHLNGQLPQYTEPQWTGQDVKDKKILIVGEQGHGDNIQFSRFIRLLLDKGAEVIFHVAEPLVPLFFTDGKMTVIPYSETPTGFDYWAPIMSLPKIMGVTLENLNSPLQYLAAQASDAKEWHTRLGFKTKLRVGFAWSGRRDSWINQHKAMPFEAVVDLISRNPDYDWFNLQLDCTDEERAKLLELGVRDYSADIKNFADTAGLVSHMDVVISVDTAVAHLAGSLGRPVWIPLNLFGQDWRWLLSREDSPWYPSARLFRQVQMGRWDEPVNRMHNHLKLFKI